MSAKELTANSKSNRDTIIGKSNFELKQSSYFHAFVTENNQFNC